MVIKLCSCCYLKDADTIAKRTDNGQRGDSRRSRFDVFCLFCKRRNKNKNKES